MGEDQMITQTVPVSQARQKFGELINRVYRQQVRIIVEKSGIPVVALVSLADLERWSRQDRESEGVGPVTPGGEKTSTGNKPGASTLASSPEERERRRALVSRILTASKERVISPLTTADLVHQVRQEEGRSYETGER